MTEGTTLDPQQAARHVPPSSGVGGLLSEAPALNNVDWLPAGANDELDELREEHVRLHSAAVEIGREISTAKHRHESEDLAYAEALRGQAMGQGIELPEVTPPEARAAELAPLEAKARANLEVREQLAHRALATIAESYEGWVADLDGRDAEDRERVEDARRALVEAEAQIGKNDQLRVWLERTSGRHRIFKEIPGRHIPFTDLAAAGTVSKDAMHTGPQGGNHA